MVWNSGEELFRTILHGMPAQHEDGPTASRCRGRDVTRAVTDRIGGSQINAMLLRGLSQQSGFWFPTGAPCVGMMRARINLRYFASRLFYLRLQIRMDGMQILDRHVASTDAGLVGKDE